MRRLDPAAALSRIRPGVAQGKDLLMSKLPTTYLLPPITLSISRPKNDGKWFSREAIEGVSGRLCGYLLRGAVGIQVGRLMAPLS